MPEANLKYFELLKRDASAKLRETHPGVAADISTWKGDEISKFQEDLMQKVSGRISEKWFYTHIKNNDGGLPRIDMLNLLSRYAGYEDWNSYKGARKISGVGVHSGVRKALVLTAILTAGVLSVIVYTMSKPAEYRFCFVNAMSRAPLDGSEIEVAILNDHESPYRTRPDSLGCLAVQASGRKIRLVVKGPYYRTDTITRIFSRDRFEEAIPVKVNDYALMIHIFSKGTVSDWKKRRLQLDQMFADDARIFQVSEAHMIGVEMYNKQEFIDKLTMPVKSLQNIDIIETIYEGGKIIELRFKQRRLAKE